MLTSLFYLHILGAPGAQFVHTLLNSGHNENAKVKTMDSQHWPFLMENYGSKSNNTQKNLSHSLLDSKVLSDGIVNLHAVLIKCNLTLFDGSAISLVPQKRLILSVALVS